MKWKLKKHMKGEFPDNVIEAIRTTHPEIFEDWFEEDK